MYNNKWTWWLINYRKVEFDGVYNRAQGKAKVFVCD